MARFRLRVVKINPASTVSGMTSLPFLQRTVIYRRQRMRIDLLHVNRMSFTAKGQGEPKLRQIKIQEFGISAFYLSVKPIICTQPSQIK